MECGAPLVTGTVQVLVRTFLPEMPEHAPTIVTVPIVELAHIARGGRVVHPGHLTFHFPPAREKLRAEGIFVDLLHAQLLHFRDFIDLRIAAAYC